MATAAAHWNERGTQKTLSQFAHARIFSDLHKKRRTTPAATLLSTAAPGAMAWVTFNDHCYKTDTLSNDTFRTAMRFSLGLDQTNLVAAAAENVPCGHCDAVFPTAEHYQAHTLTIKAGSAGRSTYNTHNYILEAVANCARAVGAAYSVGATCNGVGNTDFTAWASTKPNGTRCVKHADIAILNMPHGAFNAQRVYGDVTHRSVVVMTAGTPTPMHGAHVRASAALQHADAEKTHMFDEALRGRQNEKAAILAIEAGGRMHKHFSHMLDTFVKLKADADAGPIDDDTDPAKAKLHKPVFARTKSALWGRIQVARVKCVAERIMLITCPHTRRPTEGHARSPNTSPHTRRHTGEEN